MKKYLLLYISLFFGVGQLSLAMDYDQDEGEYNGNYGNGNFVEGVQQTPYNGFMQNNNAMPVRPGFISQNGMQNNEMAMQSGFVPQNGMMFNNQIQGVGLNNGSMVQTNFIPQNRGRTLNQTRMNRNNYQDNITKQEHVQSLVNNILKINGKTNNGSSENITKNGGIVINKNLKNKLLRLQKDLEEINKSLNNVLQNESKKSLKNKKSKSVKASKSKKSARRRNHRKKTSTFNEQKRFYTVKQLTPQSRKYIPSSSNYSSNEHGSDPYKSGIYKMKSWGTGKASSSTPYYPSKSYFSNKSNCVNGCESE